MERPGGVGIILSSQSLKVREHQLRDQSKNWRLLNWTVKKQEMVQRVAGSYKHNDKPCGPITGKGFLDSYITVNFSRGLYSVEFINDWTLTINLTL